jgi:hypothetical protein
MPSRTVQRSEVKTARAVADDARKEAPCRFDQ